MKIWIITSSPDSLYLFQFLHKHNFSYTIWYDQEWAHWWDKELSFVQKRIEMGIESLIVEWVQKFILPPSRELVFLNDSRYQKYILPLFSTYLMEKVLPWSRMGKIGMIGDWCDLQHQDLVKAKCVTYTLLSHQTTTKSFRSPFIYWTKSVPMRKHFLVSLWRKNWMMHNVVKDDLRYFTDAGVDTLIPLNYGYFAYDVTIAKFFRSKKCRWHRLSALADVFATIVFGFPQDVYSVQLIHTGIVAHLQAEKKWMWLLQRGKGIDVIFNPY